MISKELETTLNTALREAKRRRHEYVCLEHLLYALLQDKDAGAAMLNCGGDLERLRKSLEEFFSGQLETLLVRWRKAREQLLPALNRTAAKAKLPVIG